MSETNTVVDSAAAQEAFASEVNPAPTQSKAVANDNFTQVNDKGYSEDDLKRVREQEKSKLYPQIDSLKEEINLLKKDREDRLAELEFQRKAAEEEARKKAESEMDTRELLAVKEKEWEDKFNAERQERLAATLLFEKERQYAELSSYKNKRVQEESENIIPELVDLISGNTSEEIENSIAGLKDRSSKILESAQSAMQSARREMKGTSTTLPPTMENNSDQQQFTADQIAAMSVTEYAKHRDRLFPGARNQNKGILG